MKKAVAAVAQAVRAFRQSYNDRGEELPDKTPVAVPLDFKRPPDIHSLIAQYVRSEAFRQKAEAAGAESFEEANDFDLGEEEFDDVPTLHEMHEEIYNQAQRDADRVIEERKKREDADADRSGVGSAGQVGEAGKGNGKSVEGAAGKHRKAASGVADGAGGE